MRFNPHSEWLKMWDAIDAELQRIPISQFENAWKSGDAKTSFNGQLFTRVAERLGYKLCPEFLKIDFVITNPNGIPVAFIESENNHSDAEHEIDKLCAVSSPIKILELSCDWSDSERAIHSPPWRKRIELQHRFFGEDCIYVIMVGEWGRRRPQDEILRYVFDIIDHRGAEIGGRTIEISGSGHAEPAKL